MKLFFTFFLLACVQVLCSCSRQPEPIDPPSLLKFNIEGGRQYSIRTSIELNFDFSGIDAASAEYRVDTAPDMSSAVWMTTNNSKATNFIIPIDCRTAPDWQCTVTLYFQLRGIPLTPVVSNWESAVVSDDVELVFVHPDIENLFEESPIIDGNGSLNYRRAVAIGYTDTPAREDKNYRLVTLDTGVDILSSSAGNPNSDTSKKRYPDDVVNNHKNDTKRLDDNRVGSEVTVEAVRFYNDIELALKEERLGVLSYIQKPWSMAADADIDKEVQSWYGSGLRVVQLAYNKADNDRIRSRTDSIDGVDTSRQVYAGGGGEDNIGLTGVNPMNPGPGLSVVNALFKYHMIVDVSHVGRQSTLDILDVADSLSRPVIANHVNACAQTKWSRNKDDWEICRIARTGGVIGVTPIRSMVVSNPPAPITISTPPASADFINQCGATLNPAVDPTTEQFIRHIEHIMNLGCDNIVNGAPSASEMENHISVASDSPIDGWPSIGMDRQFYLNSEMARTDRMKVLASYLYVHYDYSVDRLKKIFGGNLMRVYSEALPRLFKPVPKIPISVNPAGFPLTQLILQWSAPDWQGADSERPAIRYDVFLELQSTNAWLPYIVKNGNTVTTALFESIQTGQHYRWKVVANAEDLGVKTESDWHEFYLPQNSSVVEF